MISPCLPVLRGAAGDLYASIRDLPIVSPHGHCDAGWFAANDPFPDPAALLVTPDHYLLRMLYSHGVPMERLGVGACPADRDPRAIFAIFAQHWDAFLGTPTRMWMEHTLHTTIGVETALSPDTSDLVYDHVDDWLRRDENRPRALFDAFGIEVLATTDPATADLLGHAEIATSPWPGRVIPTFRPDAVIDPAKPAFREAVRALGSMTATDTASFAGYLDALRSRRAAFRDAGATATDHDAPRLMTEWLPRARIEHLHGKAIAGTLTAQEAAAYHAHMLTEMAQMSAEDGLVMQIHAGSTRSTNRALAERFGPDMGADIPRATNWVDGLDALLNRVGNDPRLRLIVFTLDEAAYARELAPMAGHWPAMRLGPPWWFHDSLNGIRRYFDRVVETAGYGNLAGFNDDTRAFLSIPARHDLWRRGVALHLSDQIDRGVLRKPEAERLAGRLAADLAREAYRLGPA